MNCFNHPHESAVAICPVCGRAFCRDCMDVGTTMCRYCRAAYLRSKTYTAIRYLIILAVIGTIGYAWNFMGNPDSPQKFLSAYMLMSFCTGIYFLYGRFSLGAINIYIFDSAASGVFMLLGFILKIILSMLLGLILTPIVIIRQLFIIIKNRSVLVPGG